MTIRKKMSVTQTTTQQNGYSNGGEVSPVQNPDRIIEDGHKLTDGTNGHDNQMDSRNGQETESGDNNSVSQSAKRKHENSEIVQRLIQDAKQKFSVTLDLSKKGLRKVPDELLELTHVEYLYLEGNSIACLPDNFFDCLPNLQWLDLRNNSLLALPSTYIGRHARLRNLLLQGNDLRTLPLELGLVTTINGLNIADNPLEFPPQEVIERGTNIVLAFLREVLKAKSQGRFPAVPKLEDLKLDSEEHTSEDEWGRQSRKKSHHSSRSLRSSQYRHPSAYKDLVRTQSEELVGPVMLSAALQRRTSHNELKQQQMDKLRKAGALGSRDPSGKSSSKRLAKLSQYPEPPPQNRTEQAYLEERRLAKIKDMKEKQDAILQRRRDEDALKEWRDEGKQKQVQKHREKMIKGKIEYDEPAKVAPFGVDDQHMKMETNKERIARDIREKHENMRRTMSPGAQQKMDEERRRRDYELEEKLRMHTQQMQERRRKPQGNPQEEMMAAKKELEIAENLQKEIEHRRKVLEYRFTAFTG